MTVESLTRRQRTAGYLKELVASSNLKSLFNQKSKIALTAVVLVAGVGASLYAWQLADDDNGYRGKTIGLNHYSLLGPPIELNMLSSNASGITYNPDTDTLFAISNGPTYLVEMDKQGQELRKITLEGFQDTEGLTYLGRGRFAIVEERIRSVVIVKIDAQTRSIARAQARSVTLPGVEDENNKGFEGIAFNAADQSLFVVNEDEPRQLLRIDGFVDTEARHFSVSHPWNMEENSLGKRDLSGVHFDPRTGHLLVLSDESGSLTESSLSGEVISRLSLASSQAGFKDDVPQAEGVTMDNHGQLYILSEPNLLYRLGRDK